MKLSKALLLVSLFSLFVVGGEASLAAQPICRSGDPCILTMGGASGYPAPAVGCSSNYITEYKRRFLQDHFDNGTPNDFTDDPIIIGFSTGANLFGNMANMSDPLSLPSTAELDRALSLAQSTNTPFLIHIGQWGCMNDCYGARSAAVARLMGQHENWMLDPNGNEGFDFFWCDPAYTLTQSLHPNAGTGPDGLQVLFDRNLRHLARWVKTKLFDIPANTKYLIGVVPYSETHFGDPHYTFDRNPAMLDGFRADTQTRFGCQPTNPAACLAAINASWNTTYTSLAQVQPPTADVSCPATSKAHCNAWDDYRKKILKDHLQRVATVFQQEGVPSSYVFGHDLVGATGFVPAFFDITGRNPGLTAYGPALDLFASYGGCTPGQTTCRSWAITEGFFESCSNGTQDPTCYANDMDYVFGVGARFIFAMSQGLGGTKLIGGPWEKAMHLWGMRYSNKYQNPQATLTYNASTRNLSGCVYDNDSVWLGPLVQNGSIGTMADLNNVDLEIRIPSQPTIAQTALVPDSPPTCPAGSPNLNRVLPAGTTNFSVWAKDYPTDQLQRVYCYRCDDGAGPQQYVDTPVFGATISGNYRISGWAIDYAGVTSITFKVDNQQETLASRTNRADVCAYFPTITDPNCPNVGFEGYLNTLAYANGAHTLRVTSTDAFGRTTTTNVSINIQNAVADTTPPQQYVDTPAHDQQISGQFRVSGWALDASSVASFRFEMDGQPLTLRSFQRIWRGDVCSAVPSVPDPGCPNVGWEGYLSSAAFANGTHTLKVVATDTRGNAGTFLRTLRIQNTTPDTAAPQQYVDVPAHAQTMSGTMTASGWSIDASGVVALTLQVDNGALLPGVTLTSRADVCAAFPSLADPNCPMVGWSIPFNTRTVANGVHTLTVKATDQGGRVATFVRSFVVQN